MTNALNAQNVFSSIEQLNKPFTDEIWSRYLSEQMNIDPDKFDENRREALLGFEKQVLTEAFIQEQEALALAQEAELKAQRQAQANVKQTTAPTIQQVQSQAQQVSSPGSTLFDQTSSGELLLVDEAPQNRLTIPMEKVLPGVVSSFQMKGFEPTHTQVAQLDPCYAPPKSATKSLLRWMFASNRRKSFKIMGPTGSGKTALTSYISAKLGWKLKVVPCDSQLTPASLRGFMSLRDGMTQFQLGSVAYAYKHGYLLVMDEGDRLSEQCDSFLNVVAEGRPMTIPETGEVIYPHPDFRLVMTGNTNGAGDLSGLYPDTKIACVSSQNRYRVTEVGYLDKATETQVIRKAYPAFPKDFITPILEATNLARDEFLGKKSDGEPTINIAISTRSLLDWIEAMMMEPEEAMSVTFKECISGLGDKESESTVSEFFVKSLGKSFSDPNWFEPYRNAISGGVPEFFELYEYQAKGYVFEVAISHDDDTVYTYLRKSKSGANKTGIFKLVTYAGNDLKGYPPAEFHAGKVSNMMKKSKAHLMSSDVTFVNNKIVYN